LDGKSKVVYASGTIRDIDTAIESRVQKGIDAILVNPSAILRPSCTIRYAGRRAARFPASIGIAAFLDAGGLMSYGSSVEDLFRQVGVYAAASSRGEKPADLPVQRPTKFELVINLKTAKALGWAVPQSAARRRRRGDRVRNGAADP